MRAPFTLPPPFAPCARVWLLIVGLAASPMLLAAESAVTGSPSAAPAEAAAVQTTPVEPRGVLTLKEAIRIGLEANPELKAVAAETQVAAAQQDQAKAVFWPSLHAVGGAVLNSEAQRIVQAHVNNSPGAFSDGALSGDLVLSMPLFTGGRLTHEFRAAELLRTAAEQRLARSRDELVFNITAIYASILAQDQIVAAVDLAKKAMLEQRRRMTELAAAGKVANVDCLRTDVRVAELVQRLTREKNLAAIQRRLLVNQMGGAWKGEITLADALVEPSAAGSEMGATGGVGTAIKLRADYLAAQRIVQAQEQATKAAHAGHYPTLSLQAAYGNRSGFGNMDDPAGSDRSETSGRVGLVLDIPLFEGGRITAREHEARAKLTAARERLNKLELQMDLEVETAALTAAAALERYQTSAVAVTQATESLRIERDKYAQGRGTITDVLDAQSAQVDAQTTLFRAQAEWLISVAQWQLATGQSTPMQPAGK